MALRVTNQRRNESYPTGEVGEVIADNLKGEHGGDYQIVRTEDGKTALKRVNKQPTEVIRKEVVEDIKFEIPEVKKDVRVLKKIR